MKNHYHQEPFRMLFFAVCILSACIIPAAASPNIISQGDTVFLGEEGLDISRAVPDPYTHVAYFQPGTSPDRRNPTEILAISNKQSWYISPVSFQDRTGTWYQYDIGSGRVGGVAFIVRRPTILLRLLSNPMDSDLTNRAISRDSAINFRIETNLNEVTERFGFNPGLDGYVSLSIRTPHGSTYSAVRNTDGSLLSLEYLSVDRNPWYLVEPKTYRGWNVAYTDSSNTYLYPSGTYIIWPEIRLNNLADNYPGSVGNDKNNPVFLTVGRDALSIETNTDSIQKGGTFTTTITGSPEKEYYIWVKGTGKMSGRPDDQPPMIMPSQERIYQDSEYGPYLIGMHPVQSFPGQIIRDDVPALPFNGVYYYAQVITDKTGTATVGWRTTDDTRDRQYTIRIEEDDSGSSRSDEVKISVIEGFVSIKTESSGIFFLGTDIPLYGMNSDNCETYLFITGPNLPSNGGRLTNPTQRVVDGDPNSFTRVTDDSCETWQYTWYTGNLGLDAGAYSIYAVNRPVGRNNLQGATYSIIPITFRNPYLSVTPAQNTLVKGDAFHITGIGPGDPNSGVAIWIFGKNYVFYDTTDVESDGTFDYTLDAAQTSYLFPGQYQVVVQHPMYNGQFDVYPDGRIENVLSVYPYPGSPVFRIGGQGALESDNAAYALKTILDSPFIDDTYYTSQFIVTNPKIVIYPVPVLSPGEGIEITGETNLGTDNELLIEISENWFGPVPKSYNREFSGISGTTRIIPGYNGNNRFSFVADTRGMNPGEYMVRVSGIRVEVSDSTMMTLAWPVPTTAEVPMEPTVIQEEEIPDENEEISSQEPTPSVPVPADTTTMQEPVESTPIPTESSNIWDFSIPWIGLGGILFLFIGGILLWHRYVKKEESTEEISDEEKEEADHNDEDQKEIEEEIPP
ncbi:MAG: DUF3821 domain-containing protein [Methanospirillaceae archaeon]|nr:DUF3821 domain-containing protein [Methanospirillaceae archaeon]